MDTEAVIQIFNTSGFQIPISEDEAAFLLKAISNHEACTYEMVEVVYVDEAEIVRVNRKYLSRDYVTDIISFRYDEDITNGAIEGSLYCCAQRIAEQASDFEVPVKDEFLRVLIHGLIHLIGYDDKTSEEKTEMTRLEDLFLVQYAKRYFS